MKGLRIKCKEDGSSEDRRLDESARIEIRQHDSRVTVLSGALLQSHLIVAVWLRRKLAATGYGLATQSQKDELYTPPTDRKDKAFCTWKLIWLTPATSKAIGPAYWASSKWVIEGP